MKRMLSLVLTFILILGLMPGAAVSAANGFPFTDVAENAWYYTAIDSARKTGIIAGMSATEFAPNNNITLAQAVTFAARMSQYAETGTVTIKNDPGLWYMSYVNYCQERGIIDAADYEGRWGEAATRSEMVKIFYACMPASSFTAINSIDNGAIPDVGTRDEAAVEIYAFYRAGILTGSDTAGNFMPDTNIKRSEVATIISRMLYPEQRKSLTLTAPKPDVPGLDAEVTADNVMAVLNAYCPDGAYILQYALDTDSDFLFWWNEDRLCEGINIGVHEECHSFTWAEAFNKGHYNAQAFYTGGGECIFVPYTTVYNTLEMADSVPLELRTGRYDLYVGTPYDNLGSQVNGVYGLFNEYAAYYWGTSSALELYDYYMDQDATPEQWMNYVFDIIGTWGAYSEFRYFMLHYMLYARDNYPDVYNGIMANGEFREAFTIIDNNHLQLKEEIWSTFDTLSAYLDSKGVWNSWSGTGFTINGNGYSMMMDIYGPFLEVMEKAEYVEMADLMKN